MKKIFNLNRALAAKKKIYSIILTAVLLCCGTSVWGDDLTLTVMDESSSNQKVPVDGYNLDGAQHSQLLFLSSELSAMNGGTIKGLKFYFNKTGHSWNNSSIPTVVVRLKEVENSSLTSLVSTDGSTQVYSGTINLDFTNKLFTITFDDAYSYGGGNLLIDFQTTPNSSNYVRNGTGSSYMRYYGSDVSGRAMSSSTAQGVCPKTTFTYEEAAVVGGCNKPKNVAISTELPDGATFTWEQNVDETVYQWACVASGDAVEAWNTLAENVRTKTVEGLTAGTAYDFYVRSYCGEGEDKQSDAVKKTFTPSCPAPTYPATPVTAKAATTATITWNAADGISKYQYICVEKNAAQDWSKLKEVATTSADLAGLTAYTEYDFYVRSWYSATSISDAVKTTFRTECAAVNAPYAWNFEDATAGATPGCWDNSASTAVPGFGSDDYNWTAYSYSSNKSLRMYNSYLKKDGISLINTPSIVLPASPAQELAFTYSHRASCGDFMVKISTDGGANFTDLKSYSRTAANSTYDPGTFEEATISLADYAGETIILQFFATADYDEGAIFVDDLDIHAASSCAKPSAVSATATSHSTASVAWTNGGEETAWNIRYSIDGENWTTVVADANPFGLTGLSASTTYQVQVQANCGGDQSLWVASAEPLETPCAPAAIGWSEDFNGASALPECWKTDAYGNGNGQWYMYSNDARFNARVNTSTYVDLQTPPITLSDIAELVFTHSGTSVAVGLYINAGEGDVLLMNIPKKNQKDTCDLSAYKGKTVYFIFRAQGYGNSSVYFYLEDLKVSYKPVAAPTNLTATPANASAVVTWKRAEADAKDSLRYRVKDAEPEAEWTKVANIEGKTYTIESLTNGTTYEVQVKTVASANRQSEWTASAIVTPVSCASVETVTFGAKTYNSVVVNWTATAAATWNLRYKAEGDENWTPVVGTISEQTYNLTGLTTNTAYTIAVKPSCNDAEEAWVAAAETVTLVYTAPATAAVANATDTNAVATWAAVADATGYEYIVVEKDAAVNWESARAVNEATVELKNLQGLTDYDFYVRATYPASGVSAATKTTFATIGYAPKNLTAGEITTTTATFTWEANGAAVKYQWSTDNTNWSDAQTEITATATGLNAGTAYTFYVRSYYAEGKYSAAVNQAFSTECATVAIGWSESFGTVSETKPNCWTIANWGTSANSWTTAGDYAKTGVALRYNARTMSSSDAITPSIEITDKCQLTFYIRNSVGSSSAKVECKVLVNDGNETTEIAHITTRYTTATLQTLDLSAYKGKTVTIIFRGMGYDTSGSPYLWIDDVAVNYVPVATPTALAVEPGNASAVVTWERAEADAKDSLRYRVNGSEDKWTKVANIEGKTYTIESLTNGTTYEVQVKTVASTNRQSAWTASQTFTPVDCPSVETVTFGAKTYNSVVVNWTATAAATWNLRYKAEGDENWTPVAGTISEQTYNLTGLTTNTAYTIAVKPSCNDAEEAWVAAAETVTLVYTAPATAAVANATDTNAVATWAAVADATGYEYIVVEKDAAVNWESARAVNEATVELKNLQGLTDYDFYVRATYPASGASAATKATFATIGYAPKNLTAGEITTTTATFTWEANGAAVKYQWSTDNTNWSDAQTELTATATGLNAGTSYTFYVRSYYAEGKYSAAINLPFNTECDIEQIGYTQDFEAGGKPLCWEVAEENWAETFSQSSTGNKWSNRYGSTTHQGNYALYYNSKTSTANSADITMPRIAIDKAAKLLFYIKNNYEVTGEVRIAADEVETQVVALKTTSNNFNTLQEIELAENFIGKTVTITFHAQGAGTSENSSSLAIDDIEIAQVCQKPTNLAATATSDGAEVTWEGEEDQYQYCVVNAGNDPAGWVLLESGEKSVTITGKQVGKSYDVYVRAYCGAANQSAAVMTTFVPAETPSGFGNTNADGKKAVKLIENDQMIIIRDGVKYNAQGQKLQ